MASAESGAATAADGGGGAGDGAALYDETRVASLRIEVSEEALATLRSDAKQAMGYEDFTYVQANVTLDGVAYPNVGLRVKGNNSRTTAQGDAVPFKIDANRFVEGQRIDGQTKINLHNNVNQPAAMNEYLSYGALRAAGIAASRTGWADVWLNGTRLGVYTLVEQVGDDLLGRYYDDGKADLYKPEAPAGWLTYLGATIDSYTNVDYQADNETNHATFLKLVETLDQSDASALEAVIDVDSVLDYFAANVALGNWDTYVSMGHNYYLFEATPGRMVMLPWDLNLSQAASSAVCPAELSFGGGGAPGGGAMGGLPEGFDPSDVPTPPAGFDPNDMAGFGGANMGMGGAPPDGAGGGMAPGGSGSRSAPLHDKLLSDPTYFARYLDRLRAFLAGPGGQTALLARIDQGALALSGYVTDSALSDLRNTVSQRVTAISSALETTTSCGMVGTSTASAEP